jgi:internalin A
VAKRPSPGSPEHEAEDRINKARKVGAIELDLSSMGLTGVPETLGRLAGLKHLNLSGNQLTTVPSSLRNLGGLRSLDLSVNQIAALPEWLGSFTELRQFSVWRNHLAALPESLGNLAELEQLNLSLNQLAALPESLGNLAKLYSLNLSHNGLAALPASLGNLGRLLILNLAQNSLLGFPASFSKLTGVQFLNLGGNKFTALPEPIRSLTELVNLNLAKNELAALPEWAGNFANLRWLDLSDNRLTVLPESLASLYKLQTLDITNNRLAALPKSFVGFPALEQLFLHGNEALGIPPEILGAVNREARAPGNESKAASPASILDYYFRKEAETSRPLDEAKVLLVGQGGVGKTSLVRRLIEGRFDIGESKTEGIRIAKAFVPGWVEAESPTGDGIRLNIWDFGGQEIMHATHQFFLTKRSLYLLVLDARQGENEANLHYWLKIIQSFGGDSPVLVVINKIDEHAIDLNERRLRLDYAPNLVGFYRVSCKTGVGTDALRAAIVEQVSTLPHVRDPVPASFVRVRQRLDAVARERDYVGYGDFEQICEQSGVRDSQGRATLLRFLHDLGIVLNYNDPGSPYQIEDTNILNPEWVTGGVYRILMSRRLAERQGLLELSDLESIFRDDSRYPPERYAFVVGMMRKFELCFEFPESAGRRMLVPEMLPRNEPDLAWDQREALNLEYRYSILPGGLICRFIVKMQHRLPPRPTYWRSGVVLEIGGNRALVRSDSQESRIVISVQGPAATRRHALAEIRRALDEIHQSISKLGIEAKVPLPDEPSVVVDYEYLLRLEQRGIGSFLPPGSEVEYRVKDLLDLVRDTSRRATGGAKRGASERRGMPATLRIARVILKNIRCFESFELDLTAGPATSDWALLFGENGVGKTTFLRSIATGLCDSASAMALINDLRGSVLREGSTSGSIEIEFGGVGWRALRLTTKLSLDDGVLRLTQETSPDFPRDQIFACGYGAARRGFGSLDYAAYNTKNSVYTLFNYDSPLQNPELVFRRLASRGYSVEDVERRIDAVLMLPTGSTRVRDSGISISGPWGRFAPLGAVGDGYQATLAWIADLLGWAFFYNPAFLSNEISGVVLIDELEQHLHPRWQREMIRLLYEQFPQVQFIATSHSPLCALATTALPEGTSKLAVLRGADDGVEALLDQPPKGRRADQVLTSPLFGLFSASSFDVPAEIQEYAQLKSQKDRTDEQNDRLQTLRNRLDAVLTPFENDYQRRIEHAVRTAIHAELEAALTSGEIGGEVLDFEIRRKLRQVFGVSDQP